MDRRARLGALASVFLGLAWACGSSSSSNGSGDGGSGDGGSSSGASSSGGGSGSTSSSGSASGSGGSSGSGSGGGSGSSSSSGGGSGSGSSSGGLPSGRSYPDTNAVIALLVDQLPTMNMAQMQFATSHYVGTEKQVLSVTQQLRALNKDFLVLHYHLCLWQSGPMTPFICDGMTWCNDYPTVTMNESWFWHNTNNERVIDPDMALLMNVSVPAFQQYWEQSLETQVADGQYDGIMFDSASPSLLQGWVGGNGANQDPRLAGTAAKTTQFTELGNATWIAAWQTWITKLSADLAAKGIPLIPNDGAFITSWDNTDYTVTSGVFSEGFADQSFALSDWVAATDELLKLASLDRIMILQNYLTAPTDVAKRMYYLGNYLLVKGHHTYLDYFASGPLEWYPEWGIDLGAPSTAATTDVGTLLTGGVYRRDFAKGSVLVNPSSAPVTVSITGNQVVPMGGGAVDTTGATPGTLSMNAVTSVTVGPTTAEIVLH
ncbi:MAG TPA: putative glycoside hydrolase [Polyangiaceae bacterium]